MSEQELKSVKWLTRTLWVSVLANIALVFTGVYFIGGMKHDLDNTEEKINNCVTRTEYEYTDKMAYDAYNKAYFDKDTRFNSRGQQVEIN